MSAFDDRQKAFERKYALNEELAFKINARRHKLLGLWAAEKLGRSGEAADAYAKEVVQADFDAPGDDDVLAKLLTDFAKAGLTISDKEIRVEMARCLELARQQIAGAAGNA